MDKKKFQLVTGSYQNHCKQSRKFMCLRLSLNCWPLMKSLLRFQSCATGLKLSFDAMTLMNRVQSKVYKTALFTEENPLLCAPTGLRKQMWRCYPYFSRLFCIGMQMGHLTTSRRLFMWHR
ncbi:hypothetical protein MKX01_011052 [Papaver californicum]|nr:hypothetical protein MKX01_011052 [Papaver californicum]